MFPLDGLLYSPSLRAKKGEFDGCFTLDDGVKEHLLPQLTAPTLIPSEDSTLTSDQMMNQMVDAIAGSWASRPCLLDCRFIKGDEIHSADTRIAQFLRRLRLAGSRVIPVVGLAADYHSVFAASEHITASASGAAIRIKLDDLSSSEIEQLIEIQLTILNVRSTDCLLVLDLSEADLSEAGEFSRFISSQIIRLHAFGPWHKIIIHLSDYPQQNPTKAAGDLVERPRTEWEVWQRLLGFDTRIQTLAMFGDFGADHGLISYKPGGGLPITHLRYATSINWEIHRGDANRESIRTVARRITESASFSGERFSWGDEFIASRARGAGDVGVATTWRTVNMNHHMTLIAVLLGNLTGSPISQVTQRRTSVQENLFASMDFAK